MSGHDQHDTINEARPSPVITFDYELYADYMDEEDLTEEEKQEFLRSLWNLVVEFMALGFEIHPVQQAQNACGEFSKTRRNPPISGSDAVGCRGSISATEVSGAALGITPEVAERIQE